MDPNQVNQNPTPAGDAGIGAPVVDPNAGVQIPVEPTMPTPPPVIPVEPVAPQTPEPVEPVAPVAPIVEEQPAAPDVDVPVAPLGGDMGGEQTPPTVPPATV